MLTGSAAAAMMATIKSGEAASRRNLRVRIVLEQLTGRSQESDFQSQAMIQGTEREADATALYEALTCRLLETTGFIQHDTLSAGVSLDGHVGDFEGIIEAKCPTAAVHLGYLKSGKVPADYLWQCIHGLWMTNAGWCDWISYNPDFPEPLRSKMVRIEWDSARIAEYDTAVKAFLSECDAELDSVRAMMAVTA